MDILFKTNISLEHFIIVNKEVINNLFTCSDENILEIEANVIENIKQELRALIMACKYDADMIREYLNSNDWNQEKVNSFSDLIRNKMPEILSMSVIHHNSSYGEVVTEFDWVLKLILGSSKLKTIQYPLLQLITNSLNYNGEKNTMTYDLDKVMLLKMINALETVTGLS